MSTRANVVRTSWVAVVVALLAVVPATASGAGAVVAGDPSTALSPGRPMDPAVAANPIEADLATIPIAADLAARYVEGELLVAFRSGLAANRIDAVRKDLGAAEIRAFEGIGVHQWRLPSGLDVEAAVRALSKNPLVRYAEPNYIWTAAAIPNDALRNDLYGMHNLGQTGGTKDADIDALEAWDVRTDASAVVVGVIDTGVDYNHQDLVGNIWSNAGETVNGLDDDGNGFVDDIRGWDCINNDNNPIDDNNHGTHVSGTIGAVGNNGVGVVGVAWSVKIMPLKFLGAGGSGSTSDAIECINYAAWFKDGSGNTVVRITSNSWGGGPKSNALRNAIEASGALFVAAAGNSGSSSKMYPAGYDSANIISVAATDHNDALASFSNYGSDWVDLGAPGVNILSSVRNNGYGKNSGTSMATPHVSGAAALVLAQNPAWTNLQVKNQILNTVDAKASLAGKCVTGGRLNVARAVGGTPDPADPTAPAAVTDLAAGTPSATTLALTWTATGDDGSAGTAYLYDVRYRTDDPLSDANWDTATPATGEPVPKVSGSAETFTVTRLTPATVYHFALKALDETGNPSPISNSASATTSAAMWVTELVDSPNDVGFYKSLAYDASGNPAIAYSDYTNNQVRFAHFNGATWDTEVVGSDYPGVSLAYAPDGRPSISWGWGKLRWAIKTGAAWTTDIVESKNAKNDVTSQVYDPAGNPSIAYRTFTPNGAGDLRFAKKVGVSWQIQVVHPSGAARYNSMAYNPVTGHPAIAYSDDPDGDGWLDAVGFAQWTGSAWTTQIVESGVVGYGVFVSLAFDPTTGYPAIHHGNFVPSRYLRWTGASWAVEMVDAGRGGTLVFDASGAAFLGLRGTDAGVSAVKAARRDPASGLWSSETVEPVGDSWIVSTLLDPSGRLSVAYSPPDGSGYSVKYGRRVSSWISSSEAPSGVGYDVRTGQTPSPGLATGSGRAEAIAAAGSPHRASFGGVKKDVRTDWCEMGGSIESEAGRSSR